MWKLAALGSFNNSDALAPPNKVTPAMQPERLCESEVKNYENENLNYGGSLRSIGIQAKDSKGLETL